MKQSLTSSVVASILGNYAIVGITLQLQAEKARGAGWVYKLL